MRNLHAHTGNKFDYILEIDAVEQLAQRGIELPNSRSLIESLNISENCTLPQENDLLNSE